MWIDTLLDRALENTIRYLKKQDIQELPRFKYKKRVRNRNKLYQKRIKQWRKI